MSKQTASQLVAERLGLPAAKVEAAIGLLSEGFSPYYIGRYRTTETGGLTPKQVCDVFEAERDVRVLRERARAMIKNIEQQGEITEEIVRQFEEAKSKCELEDLYEQFRIRRRWQDQKKKLAPFAEALLKGDDLRPTVQKAAEAINADYASTEKVLRELLAELIAINPTTRAAIRRLILEHGLLKASLVDDADSAKLARYRSYKEFSEPIKEIPSHRVLAFLRGVKENCLTLNIELDAGKALAAIRKSIGLTDSLDPHILEAILKAYENFLKPAVEESIQEVLRSRAEREAIEVFATNLRNLLMEPPAGRARILGVDPGYRTGCKMAAVSEDGNFLEYLVVHPHKPFNKVEEAKKQVLDLIQRHQIQTVAIENGTAARETGVFFREILGGSPIKVVMVSECGARDYALSKIASEELPDLPPEARSAVSIARRLMDPLYELVKIDPKSIGVGHYQDEVNQQNLRRRLRMTIQECVCEVGVDLDRASRTILSFVPGLSPSLARRVLEYRAAKGKITSREQLLAIEGMSERAFEEASPFLRIYGGSNPLDATAIHPNYYPAVEKMAADMGKSVAEIVGKPDLVNKLPLEKYVTDRITKTTLEFIKKELLNWCKEPRGEFRAPELGQGINTIDDLETGMMLEGVVTNVTNFGAFVDVGIHEDGLLHVSEMSDKYVKHPSEVVKVGDIIRVKVIAVDRDRRRVGLSMKNVPKLEAGLKKASATEIAHLIRQYSK